MYNWDCRAWNNHWDTENIHFQMLFWFIEQMVWEVCSEWHLCHITVLIMILSHRQWLKTHLPHNVQNVKAAREGGMIWWWQHNYRLQCNNKGLGNQSKAFVRSICDLWRACFEQGWLRDKFSAWKGSVESESAITGARKATVWLQHSWSNLHFI